MIRVAVVVAALVLLLGAGVVLVARRSRPGRHADDALVCGLEELLGRPGWHAGPVEVLSTPDAVAPLRAALINAGAADPGPCTVPDCPTCTSWIPTAVQAYEAAIQKRVRDDPGPFWFPRRQP